LQKQRKKILPNGNSIDLNDFNRFSIEEDEIADAASDSSVDVLQFLVSNAPAWVLEELIGNSTTALSTPPPNTTGRAPA